MKAHFGTQTMKKVFHLLSQLGKGLLQCAAIVTLTYIFCRAIPGDAVDVMGIEGGLTAEQALEMRRELGLADPWFVQFFHWLEAAAGGDLGTSLRFGRPVAEMIAHALPVTLKLAGASFALGLALALAAALYSVKRKNAWGQRWVEMLNTWSISMPTFCAGVIFILIFCIWLGWLPVLGSFILPVIIMALDNSGQIVKPLSEELKESASLPHIRTARAKGLSSLRIALYHILPNTTGILLSLSGLVLGSLVAGTLTMEILFGLPGLGSMTLNAIHGRDTPVVLACVAFIAVSLVLINTVVDILRQMADPRTAS